MSFIRDNSCCILNTTQKIKLDSILKRRIMVNVVIELFLIMNRGFKMSKSNKTINTTVGIYKTQYTLINHRDGSISVKCPFVKWNGSTGCLAFRTVKITKFIQATKDYFADYEKAPMSMTEIIGLNLL